MLLWMLSIKIEHLCLKPLPNPPPLAPLPVATPDPWTQEMINEKLKKAEDLGEKGMIGEAQKALEEAEALKKLPARQEPVLDSSKYTAADVCITQKLQVYDICGAFLSVYDRYLYSSIDVFPMSLSLYCE
ncbi:hypothetical protein SLEP1_g56089 [Rubroshorea leprosula]|uniref:Uncharacterized protein n=1 Tax=Rubroshorea leprosula TaxID=152421 RepID=A0AAV5MJN1_9ROSI|nr:hypothetical protein SLEP1_g56089 [Rubroshorea leprosula]